MSIATAITAAQGRVASAYTAISNKGGTLPATQNLANMPTAIASIPTATLTTKSITANGTYNASSDNADGYSSVTVNVPDKTKFGLTIDNYLGTIDGNGRLGSPTSINGITFTGVVDFGVGDPLRGVFAYRNDLTGAISFPDLTGVSYYNCWYPLLDAFRNTNITSVSCPNLVTISKSCQRAFYECKYLSQINLQSLKTISGSYVCADMFNGCGTDSSVNELTVDLSSLESATGTATISGMFYGCSKIVTATLSKLTTLTGTWVTDNLFGECKNLTSVYLPAFTTTTISGNVNAIQKIFNGNTASTSGTCTVHFPSNLQSAVSGLSGYPTVNGHSRRIVLAFDLTATS